jgi:hypothetical protein
MAGLSNYPPGVTGNEPEIVGYPSCGNCGHEADQHYQDDEAMPGPGVTLHESECHEEGCTCVEYDQYGDEVGWGTEQDEDHYAGRMGR